jgi:hypothetical protein
MNSLWAGLEPIPIYFEPPDIDQGEQEAASDGR